MSEEERNRLTLKQVAADIGMDYRRLYTYMQEEAVKQHMEPDGKEYPASSLPRFRNLKQLDEKKLCTPKTLAASILAGRDLAALEEEPGPPVPIPRNELPKPETETPDALLRERFDRILDTMERFYLPKTETPKALPPPPEKKLLTTAEVAFILGVSEDWVRQHVPRVEDPRMGRRVRYKRSVVEEFAESL